MRNIRTVGLHDPPKPIDIDKLSRDRRDWLEIFGNQWAASPGDPFRGQRTRQVGSSGKRTITRYP